MWRVMLALGLVIGIAMIVTPQPVFACSCAAMSAREHLELADAAFVGTLISHEDGSSATSSADEISWTFEIEQVVKGELGGDQVDVRSAVSGISCGFEIAVGQRVGVTLYERNGQWHGGLCGQVDPDALLAVGQPAPAPDGEGPVALLLGNRGEDPRIIALDRQGRTLAHGAGDGEVRSISVCPGSERFVELVAYPDADTRTLAVRDMRSLAVLEETPLPDASMNIMTLYCRNQSAGEIVIHEVTQTPDWHVTNQIHRLQDGDLHTIYSAETGQEGGNQAEFDFEKGVVYVTAGYRGRDIVTIDLATGEELNVVSVPPIEGEPDYISLSLSPDGTRLAALGYQPGSTAHFRLLVIDVTTDPFAIRELDLGATTLLSDIFWLDSGTILVSGADVFPEGAPVYNTLLEQVALLPGWLARDPVLVDDTLYGLGWYGSGTLYSAPLPEGPATLLRTFDNPNLFVLASVPDEVEIDAEASQPPLPTATAPVTAVQRPTPTVESGTLMVGDTNFGASDVLGEQSTAPDNRGWWVAAGVLTIIVVGGGWGVYWLRGS